MALNLLVCALPFNTYPRTHCLTEFAKCIFWLQHFYSGKLPELSASKDFSPFLANLPKKHRRELLIFSLVLIQLISFPDSFLFFFLSWHPIKTISFRCQRHVSTPPFIGRVAVSPFCSTKTLFLVLLTTQVSVKLASLLHLLPGWWWALMGTGDSISLGEYLWLLLPVAQSFFLLITQCTSYQGNLILFLICNRKPRRLVRDI